MAYNIGIAGAWHQVKDSWVGVSDNWRPVRARWVGIAGHWRVKFMGVLVSLLPMTVRGVGLWSYSPRAGYRVRADGGVASFYWQTASLVTTEHPAWRTPLDGAAGSDFEIRATLVSGDGTVDGAQLGVWLSLSADREWVVVASTEGETVGATLRVQIRAAGATESDPLTSVDVSLSAVGAYPGGTGGSDGWGSPPGVNRPPKMIF